MEFRSRAVFLAVIVGAIGSGEIAAGSSGAKDDKAQVAWPPQNEFNCTVRK